MLINNIEYSDPEIIAKFKLMSDEIVRLNEILKRYEAENFTLQEKLDKLGEKYNAQVATIGFLEEENASLSQSQVDLQLAYNEQMIELREAKRLLKLAVEDITFILSYVCSHEKEMRCIECPTENHACNKWRYADEAEKLIGGEENG